MYIYGVTSQIPPLFWESKGMGYRNHWILCDIDTTSLSEFVESFRFLAKKFPISDFFQYKTPNGYHLIFFHKMGIWNLFRLLMKVPHIDKHWVKLGHKRGYWFLRQYYTVKWKHPMTFMKLKVPEGCSWLESKKS